MMITGPAIFYDGRTPRGVAVSIRLDHLGLVMTDLSGTLVRNWAIATLRRIDGPRGSFRLCSTQDGDARLEATDPRMVSEMTISLRDLARPGSMSVRARWITAGLLVAAAISVAVTVVFGIPAVAARLAPLVPTDYEIALGQRTRPQIIEMLAHGKSGLCSSPAGTEALAKATDALVKAAHTSLPVTIDVVDVSVPNAFALPGGSIIVLRGLFDKVKTPEEFIGVIAHELGHVAHRDAMRQLIESAGLSAVIGVVIAALLTATVPRRGYSREAEAGADAFALELMLKLKRNPAALGDALKHISEDTPGFDGALAWLSTHPATSSRIEALSGHKPDTSQPPVLDDTEWAALKAICQKGN